MNFRQSKGILRSDFHPETLQIAEQFDAPERFDKQPPYYQFQTVPEHIETKAFREVAAVSKSSQSLAILLCYFVTSVQEIINYLYLQIRFLEIKIFAFCLV